MSLHEQGKDLAEENINLWHALNELYSAAMEDVDSPYFKVALFNARNVLGFNPEQTAPKA